jgi:hypothetical protein
VNIAQAIAHLESRFGPPEETGIEPHDVEDWIPTALERAKEWAVEHGHEADFQRQDSVALGAQGESVIPSDMLAGRVTCINHANSLYDFTNVGSRAGLQFVFASVIGCYAVESGKVWTKAPAGLGDPLSGDLLITGIGAGTLGTLKAAAEPYFLDLLTEIAAERKKLNPIGRDRKPKEG